MSINLQFKVNRTRNDFARAVRVFCWRSRILRASWLLLSLFPVYLIVNLSIGIVNGEINEWSQAQSTVSLGVLTLFLFFFGYYLSPIFSARSLPREGVNVSVLVEDDGIIETSSTERSKAPWEMFSAAVETTTAFVLIWGKVGFRYYPKRTLDNHLIERFRQAIGEKIPRAKLQKPSDESGESAALRDTTNLDTAYAEFPVVREADAVGVHESLNLELRLTAEDYKRAYRAFMRRSKTFAINLIIVTAVCLYYISGNIRHLIKDGEIVDFIVGIFPAAILYIMLLCYIYFWKPARIARSAPDVGATYSVAVSDAGIAIVSNLGNSAQYGWKMFTTAIETANDFVLFRSGSQFNAYPKRMFAGPRDVEKFRELIRQNVPKAKLRPSTPAMGDA